MFEVVKLPTKTLRERSVEVDPKEITTPEFQAYLDELIETMFAEDGVGIASPQISRNIRAIVVNYGKHGPECYMNPEILKASDAMIGSEEGCLSVYSEDGKTKIWGHVERHRKISVKALNRLGREVTMELRDFPAIVMQHEIDHLNGTLFIDKATDTHTHEHGHSH
ncbi:MAG: peptide deformylase [Patescibacteria group bacterium]